MTFTPPLCQIALSVIDLRRTERWFREGLGFLPAGGDRALMRSPVAGRVQGLPRAASTCWWLVGRNPWFQLELFQFERPIAKLMRADARACDIGYSRIGVHVADFDAALTRLAHLDSPPLADPVGPPGERRACARSPDGVFVELMEKDPLAGTIAGERRDCRAAVRSVSLSTPDLDETIRVLTEGFGLEKSPLRLNEPERETIWGLAGAETRAETFRAGDVLVEAVQYLSPAGTPRPHGYRICDQGILNVAFGARSRGDFRSVVARCRKTGLRPNSRPFETPGAGVVYFNDALGFSFEVLWMRPGGADRAYGFEPRPVAARPAADTHAIAHRMRIDAPPEKIWSLLADHDGMASWSGFSSVRRTCAGAGDPNGYGAQRTMTGTPGRIVEEITAFDPPREMRYRLIEGGPVTCHQGEIRINPTTDGAELEWTIRFRPKIPGAGRILQTVLGRMLRTMLEEEFRRQASRR